MAGVDFSLDQTPDGTPFYLYLQASGHTCHRLEPLAHTGTRLSPKLGQANSYCYDKHLQSLDGMHPDENTDNVTAQSLLNSPWDL